DVIVVATVLLTGTCNSLISRFPSACWSFHIHCLPTICTSIALVGLRSMRKYASAFQAKSTSERKIGPIVQPLSIQSEPDFGFDRSAEDPRRYFTEKKMIGRKMTTAKKTEIAVRAKKSVSTSCDVVEACGGKIRN